MAVGIQILLAFGSNKSTDGGLQMLYIGGWTNLTWHVGDIDPSYLEGQLPLAPSAIAWGPRSYEFKEFVTPRAIQTEEIAQIMSNIYCARMLNQLDLMAWSPWRQVFTSILTVQLNQRTDLYGGLKLLEVTDAVVSVWVIRRHASGSPCDAHSMGDSDPLTTSLISLNI